MKRGRGLKNASSKNTLYSVINLTNQEYNISVQPMNREGSDNTSSLEDTYKILSLFEEEKVSSQRDISRHLGYSLGKVNYLVNSLIQKGFVKLDNFIKSDNKTGYYYLLTPSGIENKYTITKEFLKRKEAEYDALCIEIEKIKSKI